MRIRVTSDSQGNRYVVKDTINSEGDEIVTRLSKREKVRKFSRKNEQQESLTDIVQKIVNLQNFPVTEQQVIKYCQEYGVHYTVTEIKKFLSR